MSYDEKSGQLIECINPEHLYLGSIHYMEDSCVGKWQAMDGEIGTVQVVEIDATTQVHSHEKTGS